MQYLNTLHLDISTNAVIYSVPLYIKSSFAKIIEVRSMCKLLYNSVQTKCCSIEIHNYSDICLYFECKYLPLNLFKNNANRKKCKRSAATRDRTRDLTIFSRTLSQLSYCGVLISSRPLVLLSQSAKTRQQTQLKI